MQGKIPAGVVIAHLTAKCSGNVHDKGVVEITASNVRDGGPQNVANLGTSL
jgi:hypothetical protein